MKKLLPILAFLSLGVAAAPSSAVFLVGFPQEEVEGTENFEVLGGFQKTWLESKNIGSTKGMKLTAWNLAGKMTGTSTAAEKESYGPPCEDTYGVSLSPSPSRKNWAIASNAPWNLRPRPVTVLSKNSAPYRVIVADYLKQKGIKNPEVNITALVKTDLDNDKQDEVIIAATQVARSGNFPSARARLNDYSLLLVRKIIGGKVQTISLGEEVHLKATTDDDIDKGLQNNPDVWDLVNVLDLNGDGKLEVIYFEAIYEDYGVFAVEWTGKKFEQRLVSGCGS